MPSGFGVAATPQPNVILVMTDDQGYGDLACHGNTMIRTPNLDRLHAQSVRLTNFHVDPTCSPTRAALLTGRYSTRTGVWHTIAGRSLLDRDETLLPQYFARAGYATGIFGKWHLGDNYPLRPQDRGFQEVLVHGGGGITQTPDAWGNSYFNDTFLHNGRPESFQGYCTDVFFAQAMAFIQTNRNRPFFLYLPTNVPHAPYSVDPKYSKPYEERGVSTEMAAFYGMIEEFDHNLGLLLDQLRSLDLEQNTVLIFMTDNGTAAGVTIAPPKAGAKPATWKGFNAGMRDIKGSEYEGGYRVPFFIRWPAGGIRGPKDIGQLTAHIDVLPTLLELCNIHVQASIPLDGISLVPWLRGTNAMPPARTLFVHSQRIDIPQKWRQSAVMTDRWRLINGTELYDLPEDPAQSRNIASMHPKVVADLRASYEQWWQSLEPVFSGYTRIIVGSEKENPTTLTCHDWHSDTVPWNQRSVRNMPGANGYWMIDVAIDGHYDFTLRHQPEKAKYLLRTGTARIRVGTVEAQQEIPKDAFAVTLTLSLKAGPAQLQTWLTDRITGDQRGAFFVEIHRRE